MEKRKYEKHLKNSAAKNKFLADNLGCVPKLTASAENL